jgi:hypothetical protein
MGGRCYEIKRLGVLEICSEIVVGNFLQGNTTGQVDDTIQEALEYSRAHRQQQEEDKTSIQRSLWRMAPLGLAIWL